MYSSIFLRFASLFLAVAICLSWLPSGVLAEELPDVTDPAVEETILPEETTQPAAEPAETAPSDSGSTEPEIPEETAPAVPETTEALPEETVPADTLPEETDPADPLPEQPLPDEPDPGESQPEQTLSADDAAMMRLSPDPLGPGLYFGQFHAHSSFSDGTVTADAAFAGASQEGLDFLFLTDHGDSLTQEDWASGKAAAEAAFATGFAAGFGYEMNWPARMQLGHIGVFGTSGFCSWQAGYDAYDGALENFYTAMASTPGALGQFHHPDSHYGNFCDFSHYSQAADSFIVLLETDGSTESYVKALDAGWHLAPSWASGSRTGSFGSGRTAVRAESLTEQGICQALRSHRVYATADPDLEIAYTLDGHDMGSRLERRTLGDTADITVFLQDPTDAAAGQVEVIVEGGAVLAAQTPVGAAATLSFSLSPNHAYYFLRVTQPDGDIALTAPIWVSHTEDLGIASMTCETPVPVQNEPFTLNLSLYNREPADLIVERLEILADGHVIFTDTGLADIPANSDLSYRLSVSCGCMGQTRITAKLIGTLEGEPRAYETALNLSFRQSSLVTDILVDGSHGNAGTQELTLLTDLAAEHDIRVRVAEEISADSLDLCRFLVVTAPQIPFSDTFLAILSDYAAAGGSIILCGQANTGEEDETAFQLNRILSSLGASLRLQPDALGTDAPLYPAEFNMESPWCSGISKNQVYRLANACTVHPGGGQWLVKEENVVLACEELLSGGTVFACGSLFFSDDNIPAPETRWKEPYANRTILRNLLNIGGETLPVSTIAQARSGESGQLFRIRGFVTAGTSNPYNTFPETLYLQDDTGGIAVMPFTAEGIRVGTPLEVTGYAEIRDGCRILKPISHEILDAAMYQYQPRTGNWETLLDYAENGGMLVEVEGICAGVLFRDDGTLSGILLKNEAGQTARVLIEDGIFSGASGENTLHEEIRSGRKIRAMGLLHLTPAGETVIRVRNCEEVVYVPPKTYINPKTGDPIVAAYAAMSLSAAALILLKKKKAI